MHILGGSRRRGGTLAGVLLKSPCISILSQPLFCFLSAHVPGCPPCGHALIVLGCSPVTPPSVCIPCPHLRGFLPPALPVLLPARGLRLVLSAPSSHSLGEASRNYNRFGLSFPSGLSAALLEVLSLHKREVPSFLTPSFPSVPALSAVKDSCSPPEIWQQFLRGPDRTERCFSGCFSLVSPCPLSGHFATINAC